MTDNPYILQGAELDRYLSDMPDITELDNWFKETIEPSSVCILDLHVTQRNIEEIPTEINITWV